MYKIYIKSSATNLNVNVNLCLVVFMQRFNVSGIKKTVAKRKDYPKTFIEHPVYFER